MPKVKIVQVDAFTQKPMEGNPAAVVLDARELSDKQMVRIAREMSQPETVFVVKPAAKDAALRFFTYKGVEVKFSGHATVATMHALAVHKLMGIKKKERYDFDVETKLGVLRIAVDYGGGQDVLIEFDSPKIELIVDSAVTHAQLAQVMGFDPEFLEPTRPVMRDLTSGVWFATVKNLEMLGQVVVNYDALAEFCRQQQVMAVCLLTPNPMDRENNHVHSRVFAPVIRIDEDPVSGVVQGPLAAYLMQNGMIGPTVDVVGSEQGYHMGRPGYARVRIDYVDGLYKATVIARAVQVYEVEVEVE